VLEIEEAIAQLPVGELLEVGRWLDDQRAMLAASEAVFQMLDSEEDGEEGSQWLG
jgi:hypothetical protein